MFNADAIGGFSFGGWGEGGVGGVFWFSLVLFYCLIYSKEIEEFRGNWAPGESSLYLHDVFCECLYLMDSHIVADQHEGWTLFHLH